MKKSLTLLFGIAIVVCIAIPQIPIHNKILTVDTRAYSHEYRPIVLIDKSGAMWVRMPDTIYNPIIEHSEITVKSLER